MASSWLLLVVVALVQLIAVARSGNVVPVLLWSGDAAGGVIDPLHKTSRSEFEKVLAERLAKNQPPVMVFVKENFCVEEIKHHKQSLQLMNKAGSLSYFASVESALAAFENLPSYNVTVEDDFESVAEGQLVEVPINDINAIPDVYNVIRESSPNIVIALTGKSCSYSSSERIKRATDPKDAKAAKAAKAEQDALIVSTEGKILLYADVFPVLKIGKESHQLDSLKEAKVLAFDKNRTEVQMSFTSKTIGDVDVVANFNTSRGYVKLVDIVCTAGSNKTTLKNRVGVEYPVGNFSYHCGTSLAYNFMDTENKQTISLVFSGLQVQLNTTVFSGDVYDCVGFTTVPIWMGLFVTFMLGLIMMWGIIMIMDIRTMDRFDDPKGKTITVTAQE